MRCDQIGVQVSRQEFVNFLNGVQPGQFFSVKGYVNSKGEKADHILRFGVKYGNLKARDIAFLNAALAMQKDFTVKVKHNVWIPKALLNADQMCSSSGEYDVWATAKYIHTHTGSGTQMRCEITGHMNLLDIVKFSNLKGKVGDKVPVEMSYDLYSRHPLVVAAIGAGDLGGTLLQGLERPQQAHAEYDKEAQSAYSMEKDGVMKWYLRDVLQVHKTVRVPGDYPFSASLPINAVKEAITSQFLLTGKYRQFVLTDGQFESITIEGQAVLVDGIDEEFYFALPEMVKEVAEVPAVI